MNASIIIPTRNRSKWLTSAIQSFAEQDFPSSQYEIIVVDNGSTDNTGEITERAALLNKNNIRYIYEPEPGLLSGRHRGMSEAKGEILVFVDDDIEAVNGWLSAIMAELKDESVHMVGGPSLHMYEVDPPQWVEKYYSWKDDQLTCGSLSLLNKGKERLEIDPVFVWGLNFAIRKKTLFDLGGFHPDNIPKSLQHFQGDGETGLALKMKGKGLKAVYAPGAKVYHHIPRERLTVAYFEKRFFYQGVCDSYTQIRKNKGLSNIKIPNYQIFDQFLPNVPAYDQYKQIIYKRIHNAYVDGFLFHQEAVQKSKTLLKWVLKEDYFDYRLPELNLQEQQQIQEVSDRIQKRSTHLQWPRTTAQDMFKDAFNLINSDDMVTALSKLDTMVHQYPNMPKVHLTRALCLSALDRPREAVRAAIAELTIQHDNKQAVDILLKNQQVLLEELKTAPQAAVRLVERILKSRLNRV
ncbi:MAG: glycosyltransferase family 2 protein [Candidatus Kuenenia sp.]|uniref:glycosyltransferase n=1 Tax=Candidatus Kuenenia sp. TaxID=2499824 RepID=UPI0022BF86BE|nr:glycosyltransferase family 2 protein [Candidatus Kuenenia sp.]MCZ7623552.1 glycosyltransferase family 2 protein [Candidatus Kuenenia sp.]